MTKDGELQLDDIKATINDKTKIVAIAHVSNVLEQLMMLKLSLKLHTNMVQL